MASRMRGSLSLLLRVQLSKALGTAPDPSGWAEGHPLERRVKETPFGAGEERRGAGSLMLSHEAFDLQGALSG